MVIDSHLHFHDVAGPGHGDHLGPAEVFAAARETGVDGIAQVTPMAVGYDNDHSFEIAGRHADFVVGVIARMDPRAPGAETTLRGLVERGMLALRLTLIEPHNVDDLPRRALDPFFALVERMNVRIELFSPFRVAEMHETVRRFPGIAWLIDHLGLRYYAGQDNRAAFRQWPELIALAREPNAWIKCSYFPEAAKDIEPYPYPTACAHFKWLYEEAGAQRLIWGSNFPNVRRACTYRQAVDFVRVDCDFFSDADRDAVLGTNFLRYVDRMDFRGSPSAH